MSKCSIWRCSCAVCEPSGEGLVLEHLNKNGEYPFAVEFKGGNKREHEVLGSLYIY